MSSGYTKLLVPVLVLVSRCLVVTSDMYCYSCNAGSTLCSTTTYCSGSCFYYNSGTSAYGSRGCSSYATSTDCISTIGICYCNSDYCNDQKSALTSTASTAGPGYVTCYSCSGTSSSVADCSTCSGRTCLKVVAKSSGYSYYERSCDSTSSSTGCYTTSVAGISSTACSCSSNYCNTASPTAVFNPTIAGLTGVIMAFSMSIS